MQPGNWYSIRMSCPRVFSCFPQQRGAECTSTTKTTTTMRCWWGVDSMPNGCFSFIEPDRPIYSWLFVALLSHLRKLSTVKATWSQQERWWIVIVEKKKVVALFYCIHNFHLWKYVLFLALYRCLEQCSRSSPSPSSDVSAKCDGRTSCRIAKNRETDRKSFEVEIRIILIVCEARFLWDMAVATRRDLCLLM